MYALAQLNLLFNYIKSQNKTENSPEFDFSNPDEIPYVTIQLPVFNEIYVMDRLLKNIVLLDYPKDKLEIQVLDDSTDESVESTAALIETLQKKGFDIQHIQRTNRKGFKARTN
jgi:cellulose synthase/poly-beta-1,6-N-acetylglucosamine synthase-like glycosyltransferase